MKIEAEPVGAEDPSVLEARVLQILQVATKMAPGALRRDALTEVSRLRQRAIELRRRNAADLRARIARGHASPSKSGDRLSEPSANSNWVGLTIN